MRDKTSGVKRDYPTYDGKADRSSGRENIGAADENESPPREDAAETTRGCTGPTPRLGEDNDADDQNAIASGRNGDRSVLMTDGGQTTNDRDLTAFQREILIEAAAHYNEAGKYPYGLELKQRLGDFYGTEINHGRLYPNLDTLVQEGLIEKSELDRRTNEYALTDAAWTTLQGRHDRIDSALEDANGGE